MVTVLLTLSDRQKPFVNFGLSPSIFGTSDVPSNSLYWLLIAGTDKHSKEGGVSVIWPIKQILAPILWVKLNTFMYTVHEEY